MALLLALPASARAEGLAPTLLSYRAHDGCPEVADFQRSVQRRSTRVRFVDEGSHERELSIALSKDGAFTIGELRLIERDGSLRQRSVRFTSCSEAVEGLALITLVSLDPQALLQAPTTPEPESKPKQPVIQPAAPKPVIQPPKPSAPTPSATEAHLEPALGAEFVAGFGELPQSALGGALFLDLASSSSSWFAPLLRVAVVHSERRGLSAGEAQANFALTQGALTACPVRLGAPAISVRPCVFTSAGLLHASSSSSSSEDANARSRPSWAWGGSALLFLQISKTIDFVANFGLGSNLIRDRFELQKAPIWKTPVLYLSSGAGLRFVFR